MKNAWLWILAGALLAYILLKKASTPLSSQGSQGGYGTTGALTTLRSTQPAGGTVNNGLNSLLAGLASVFKGLGGGSSRGGGGGGGINAGGGGGGGRASSATNNDNAFSPYNSTDTSLMENGPFEGQGNIDATASNDYGGEIFSGSSTPSYVPPGSEGDTGSLGDFGGFDSSGASADYGGEGG